ncbi:MAG: phosphatase PAP2 family protein [Flavobacteriales bacterium]|nr:phosphatase PAP2 family protein [Flavobacteriales bacterium]
MIEYLENIDQKLLLFINGWHSPFWDQIMWWVSDAKFGIPFYLFFLVIAVRFYGWKTGVLMIVMGGVAVGLADLSAKYLFKEVFQRYRPSHHLELSKSLHFVNNYKGGLYGFVSSHSANMFAIATTLGLFYKAKNKVIIYWLLAWAGLIAYSRMYLGVHYPSDVFVGGILGGLIGWGVYFVSNKSLLKWE